MPDTPLCPTCHSKISPTGSRIKDHDSAGVPAWSDDPALTPTGLNGANYIGSQFIRALWIQELQNARTQQESDAGINPPTEFSPISADTVQLSATHFTELRISTERLLSAAGATLTDYFSLDADGNVQPAGPNDVPNKAEWSYVSRGVAYDNQNRNNAILQNGTTQFLVDATTTALTPTVLKNTTFISALLFEDLRHPIPSNVWIEVFSTSTNVSITIPAGTVPPFSNEMSGTASGSLCIGDFGPYIYSLLAYSTIFEGSVSNPGYCYPNNQIAVLQNDLFPQQPGPTYKSHKVRQTVESRWLLGSIVTSVPNEPPPYDEYLTITNTYAYSTSFAMNTLGGGYPFAKKPKQLQPNTTIDMFFNFSYNGLSSITDIPVVTDIPVGWAVEMQASIDLTFYADVTNQFNVYGYIEILTFSVANLLPVPYPNPPFSTQVYQRRYLYVNYLPGIPYPITSVTNPNDPFFGKSGFLGLSLAPYIGETGINLSSYYLLSPKCGVSASPHGNYLEYVGYHLPGTYVYPVTPSFTNTFIFELEGIRVSFKK